MTSLSPSPDFLHAASPARRTAARILHGAAQALRNVAAGCERRAARVAAPRPTADERSLVRARLATHGKLD